MSISMYRLTVPMFQRGIASLKTYLDKAEAYAEEKQRPGFRPELPIVFTGGGYVIDFTSCRQTEYTRLNGEHPDLELHIGAYQNACSLTYFTTDAMRHTGPSTTCTVPFQTGKRSFRSLELLDELPQYCAKNIIRTGPYMSSVDPDHGDGVEQVFTADYSLGNNGVGIAQARLHFQERAGSRTDRCVVRYDPSSKGLFLLSDAGRYLGPIAPGSNASLWNSRCLLAGCSTAEVSGDTLKVRFAIRFNPDQFAGPHNLFLELVDTDRRASPAPVYGRWNVPSAPPGPAGAWPSDRSCPLATRVPPLGVYSSSVIDCKDVSGDWSDPETGGKWSLSQAENQISGSLTIAKSECGPVIWRVSGRINAGIATLTASGPEPAVDQCGVAASRSIVATLTPDCKTGAAKVNVEK